MYSSLENWWRYLNVSHETVTRLKEYVSILCKWNLKINLISATTVPNIWERHILDSVQLIQYIPQKDVYLIDVGSGAGFPGLVLAILGIKKVTLVEANHKKAAFLQYIKDTMHLNVSIINNRVETFQDTCDIITSRAVSDISTLLLNVRNIKYGNMLLLKSTKFQSDLLHAQRDWQLKYEIYDGITNSVIIAINQAIKK